MRHKTETDWFFLCVCAILLWSRSHLNKSMNLGKGCYRNAWTADKDAEHIVITVSYHLRNAFCMIDRVCMLTMLVLFSFIFLTGSLGSIWHMIGIKMKGLKQVWIDPFHKSLKNGQLKQKGFFIIIISCLKEKNCLIIYKEYYYIYWYAHWDKSSHGCVFARHYMVIF